MPAWAESVGWLVACASMLMIPIWAVVVYCQKSHHYTVSQIHFIQLL